MGPQTIAVRLAALARCWRGVVMFIALGIGAASAVHAQCSIRFTSPARDSVVTSPTLVVSGTASGFNLTSGQEQQLEACLNKPQGGYSAVANNCTAPAQYCLQNMGIHLGGYTPLPVNLGTNLLERGIARSFNFYNATQQPQGSNAPWAR